MDKHLAVPFKDQNDKPAFLVEIDNAEKQLWALSHSKGLLHSDVQNLYCKVRSSYEKIIMNHNEMEGLQDVEYSLWKLHYKHIDEFRKRTKKSSASAGTISLEKLQNVSNMESNNDNHIEGFKSFLSEASQFYRNLILKIKRFYGLSEEAVLYNKGGMSATVDPGILQKCQFLCHRFFVCLGDLARYRELYGQPNVENHNWSVAASHYLEATMIWPNSGNPHNQLAVLATYVGDEFLALYHCVRSLAVKEPFPDAWNNLVLLFEKNRSSDLHLHSSPAYFDNLTLSERSGIQTKSQSSCDFSKCYMLEAKHKSPMETKLWSLFIRTISFFFTKSSLEDFPCAYTSMLRELDELMTFDDLNLEAALESYQCMNSARKGPFRALQVVSVFIFIFQNLIITPEQKELEPESCMEQLEWVQMALMVTFTFMGRLVNRCLKTSPSDCSPLLPAILVIVEWLVRMLDQVETYLTGGKSISSMSYFFGILSDLLNQINVSKGEVRFPEIIPLWEDYELRGYAPAACMHELLDFTTQWGSANDYISGNECRVRRIINAAMKIANRANNSRKWICYDKLGRKFFVPDELSDGKEIEKIESVSSSLEVKKPHLHTPEDIEECGNHFLSEKDCVSGRSITTEEEEVILFKPLSRYNSVPLYTSTTGNGDTSKGETYDEAVTSHECLRHALSLLVAQNQVDSNPLTSHYKVNKSVQQQEPLVNDTVAHPFSEAPISAGPPSLSGWVLNRGNPSIEKAKVTNDIFRRDLNAKEESFSTCLAGLSVSEAEDSVPVAEQNSAPNYYSSLSYSAPVPSAPLLPDDAVWFNGIPSRYPECSSGGMNKTNNPYGALQFSDYSSWIPNHAQIDYETTIPNSTDAHTPLRGMTSSEWLRQYREHHNLRQVSGYAPRNFGNFHNYDTHTTGFGHIDPWGNPLASNPYMGCTPQLPSFVPFYGADDQTKGKVFNGCHEPRPYGYGGVTDISNEQQQLLEYLKEREWVNRSKSSERC